MDPVHDNTIEELGTSLQRRGLATPALMLLDLAAPLGFLSEQLLLAARPFILSGRWRTRVDEIAQVLRDADRRERLRQFLTDD